MLAFTTGVKEIKIHVEVIIMYRIGVCDDDRVLCASLEEQIYNLFNAFSDKVMIEVWYSGEGILNDLENGTELDLIFLDIELVRQSGIDVGMHIRNVLDNLQTHIVYISSKQSYAMQLFKVQPLDFLIKPVMKNQLEEVIKKSMKQKQQNDQYFEYQKGGSLLRIPIKDIVYFMSCDKKIIMMTKSGKTEFYGKLKNLIDRLPDEFIMIHQSYVINQLYVGEYSYETVKMVNGEIFNISKPYRKTTRSKIKECQKEKKYASL